MIVQQSSDTSISVLPPASTPDEHHMEVQTQVGTRPRILYVVAERHALETEDITTRVFAEAQAVLCLLYTSPSPRDLSTSRMPSSA